MVVSCGGMTWGAHLPHAGSAYGKNSVSVITGLAPNELRTNHTSGSYPTGLKHPHAGWHQV